MGVSEHALHIMVCHRTASLEHDLSPCRCHATVSGLYFLCLDLYFVCVDLHLGCLDLYFGHFGLYFTCLDLYFGCLDLCFWVSVYLQDVTMACALLLP